MSNWGTTPELPDLLAGGERRMAYYQAIAEGTQQALAADPRVRVFGEGATDKGGTYGTTIGLEDQFGSDRVFDVPTAEGVITGMGIGMSLGGLRPIVIHPRNDFMLVCLDQIANHAAKWSEMFDGRATAGMAIRTVSCRGWGSAAQHSQALHATMAQFPGLQVALPFTPADAKGMLLYAVLEARDPVLLMEHKWLWKLLGPVEEPAATAPPGAPAVLRPGSDVTVVGLSYGCADAMIAARTLAEEDGIDAEVLDLRWLRPLDVEPICKSVEKTGRLVVVDSGPRLFGATAEIVAQVVEGVGPAALKAAPIRIGTPDAPVPACSEATYFPGVPDVRAAALRAVGK